MLTFCSQPLDIPALSQELHHASAGAVVCFEGRVRPAGEQGAVASIFYEAYEELCRSEFAGILREAHERFPTLNIRCAHRTGDVPAGEPSVWVGAAALHRREAFQACAYVIDELKNRLPIWKKEIYANGASQWIDYSQG